MLKKFWKDIHWDEDIYTLADDMHSEELREYYLIITEEDMLAGHSQDFHFDEDGIPVIPSYIDVEEQRLIYYPISIGQYGLAIWNTWLNTQDNKDFKRFLDIADWFAENCEQDDRLGCYWTTEVEKPAYRIEPGWKSAFAQARGLNILLRAYQQTGDKRYKSIAEKSLIPFTIPVAEGGVMSETEHGPFFEEYPSAHAPVLVLNGMVFSLFGLYDFVRALPENELAQSLMNRGIRTVEKILPEFDMGFWTKYCLCTADFHPHVDPSTIGYQYLHVVQLRAMHRITENPVFLEYAERWKDYVSLKSILKMYALKYKALKQMNRL